MKVLLTVPNNSWTGARTHWNSFPLTFAVLTSVIKDKYEVRILDCAFYNLSKGEVSKRILDYSPDVVGVTCLSFENDREIRELTKLIKNTCPEARVVVGGIYPTLLPERIMKNTDIDFAVMGEGEYRFPKLLDKLSNNESVSDMDGIAYRINGEVIINSVKEYIFDLDNLPFPNYDCVNFYDYAYAKTKRNSTMLPRRFPYAQISATRGCIFSCIFCSSKLVNGPKIRKRSAKSILNEIEWLKNKYGIKEVIFVDDNLFIDRNRFKELLVGLIDSKLDVEWKCTDGQVIALDDEILELMRESGCYELCISIEGGDEETLKLMNKPPGTVMKARGVVKKAKELGMYVISSFIFGLPGETWEQIRQTARLAEDLDLDFCTFNIANPLPRTRLYDVCVEEGLLSSDFSFDNFRGYGHPSITTKEFTPSELLMFRVMEWDRINFKTPEKIRRIAERNGMTIAEIEQWRVETRRGVSVTLKELNAKNNGSCK